ncbi:MAG TPA: kelch repeat-containing protein, partial [Terriglobales bacterium]|nr:kelch repeat-containing protein [Terriglobales bacterium]
MNTAHTATLLPDGKVLGTGGADADGAAISSAELYDPASGKFTPTGSMQTERAGHTASLVSQPGQSGRVIVYAGSTWELWDEASGTFSAQGNMAAAQSEFPQPAALPDGRLVIAGGGNNDSTIATEQLLTLDSHFFALDHNLNVPRSAHTLTALSGTGDLLALGGSDTVALASAELLDSNGWTLLPGKLSTARW